jgi:hypothetical protein
MEIFTLLSQTAISIRVSTANPSAAFLAQQNDLLY